MLPLDFLARPVGYRVLVMTNGQYDKTKMENNSNISMEALPSKTQEPLTPPGTPTGPCPYGERCLTCPGSPKTPTKAPKLVRSEGEYGVVEDECPDCYLMLTCWKHNGGRKVGSMCRESDEVKRRAVDILKRPRTSKVTKKPKVTQEYRQCQRSMRQLLRAEAFRIAKEEMLNPK